MQISGKGVKDSINKSIELRINKANAPTKKPRMPIIAYCIDILYSSSASSFVKHPSNIKTKSNTISIEILDTMDKRESNGRMATFTTIQID